MMKSLKTPTKPHKNITKSNSVPRELIYTRLRASIELRRTRSLPNKLPINFDLSEEKLLLKIQTDGKQRRIYRQHQMLISDRSNYIINKVGRKQQRKIAIYTNSLPKSQNIAAAIQQISGNTDFIRTQDLQPCTPAPDGEVRMMGKNGTVYKPMISFNHQQGTFLRELSPNPQLNKDLQLHVDFTRDFSHEFFKSKQTNTTFSFRITPQGLTKRSFVKRPITQKKAAGGYSAADIFKAMGINFNKKFSKYFHLAHRIGWGLGGPQVKSNIDPATAGSNYTTLFYIEDIIRLILTKDGYREVLLTGSIEYHPIYNKLPIKITYSWQWGNGLEMRKSILPLNPRGPSIQENQLCQNLAQALSYAPPTPLLPMLESNESPDSSEYQLVSQSIHSEALPQMGSHEELKMTRGLRPSPALSSTNQWNEGKDTGSDPLLYNRIEQSNFLDSSSPIIPKAPHKTVVLPENLQRSSEDNNLRRAQMFFNSLSDDDENSIKFANKFNL